MFGKDHPFSGANECHKAQVERVEVSPAHPDGWRWNAPCRCPKFQRLQHVVTEPGAPGEPPVRRTVEVQGCLHTLFAWMQGGATMQANAALAETAALRRDVQEAALPALQAFTALAQTAQGELLRQGPVVTVLPAARFEDLPALEAAAGIHSHSGAVASPGERRCRPAESLQ